MAYGEVAKGYSWLLASNSRSTTKSGMEKRQSMKNAEAYSLRQAKFESPANSCTAARREVARKKDRLKPSILNVRFLWTQSAKKPGERVGTYGRADLERAGKK